MDPHGLSVLSHLRAKPVGKLRRRVRELRTANSYYGEGGGGGPPTLDLSHSESQRLAVDALMGEGGVQGYRDLLTTEGEVDFLSEREKSYILTNQQDGRVGGDSDTVDGEDEDGTSQPCRSPLSLCRLSASEETADECATLEPNLPLGSQSGVEPSGSDQQSQTSVEVFLQSDIREGSMKDLVREQIRKAQTALVVVVDTFSDVELLCDILEACALRNVRVYVLLDRLNVQQFLDLCLTLNVSGEHFPRLSVRSVSGQGYCTKTGRWLCGQVAQTFIISDWTRVLTGCYSFSWLSWKVNRNFIVLLEGGSVTSFRQEFRRLYLSSQPVPPLFPTAMMTLAPSAPRPTQHPNPSDSGLRRMLRSQRWVTTGDHNGTTDRQKAEAAAETPTAADPTHSALSELEVEHNRAEAYVMSLALDEAPTPTQAESPSRWNREMPQHRGKAEVDHHGLSDVNVGAERRWRTLQPYASHAPPSDPFGPTFSRSYKLNVTGVDAAWSPHGPSTSRTQTSPRAATTEPATGGGRLYPDYNRFRRAAMVSGTAAVNLDTLRRSQRKDHKAQPRPDTDTQPLHRPLSQRAHNQGNTQGFFIQTQSQRQWPAAQPSPQNNRCRTQSPKRLRSPAHPHHRGPGAASKETQSHRPDAKTDFRTPANQQPESGFSQGPPLDHQSYPAQQLVPSQRLHWISQLHSRQVLQNGPGVNGTWGPRRGMEEPGQGGAAGTGARGRTSGAIGRPAALRRGASFS
ncbi:protein FAM83A-like [Gadus chalcogrammus]|uniref:protein FAM83A-like n=1 Tax=Gadus chalcogrammus TaxID=1042646 RepID=UPI0024C4C8EE|nr:protein FAM83A-like [Gadus chalcogrammus]